MDEPTAAEGSIPADADSAAGARHAALAVLSRRRMLETLQAAGEPLDVAHLAAAVGLHVTTARIHLDLLERAGLVSRSAEHAGRPGRPRQLYTAVPSPDAREGHRQLAGVLAAALAGDAVGGSSRAEQAGQQWADTQLPAVRGLSDGEAGARVAGLFDRLGFAPRLVATEHGSSVELGACPFRDVARAHPEVVCSVHLGLLRGALRRSGIPARQAQQAGLRPFVEPELCVADLPIPRQRQRP